MISTLVRRLVALAVEEDLSLGDPTSALSIPIAHRSRASIVARERLMTCGVDIVPVILDELKASVTVTRSAAEGSWLESGGVLAELAGSTREILSAERTILNFLQRLCGVASFTAEIVPRAGAMAVLDTRKTMPGWRLLDKYAVRTGGGRNHRACLGDMILVKNNHIDARNGDIEGLLRDITAQKPIFMPLEVEVRNEAELRAALPFKPDAVLLDNMNDDQISRAAAVCANEAPATLIEVSGGITPERLERLAALKVHAVSMGALTTRASNRDISLSIRGPA